MEDLRVSGRQMMCLFAAVALPGCGTDSGADASNCGAFSACGGDLTGEWVGQSICLEGDLEDLATAQGFPDACKNVMRVGRLTADSSLEVGSAQILTENGTITADWYLDFDTACVSELARQPISEAQMPAFCDAFSAQVQRTPGAPFTSMSCSAAGGICTCEAVQLVSIRTASAFELEGGTLEYTDGHRADYCIQGDALTLRGDYPMVGRLSVGYVRVEP